MISLTEKKNIPKHIAIVMDGNGRWAQRRGHPRAYGHVRGASRVKEVVREANRQGVKALTLFAFSTENWLRPEFERKILWKLLKKYLLKERTELKKENVRLKSIGQFHRLDHDLQKIIRETEVFLEDCDGLNLTFAISYGARDEILSAVKAYARDCVEKKCQPDHLSLDTFESRLWTSFLGPCSDVDLVIRTGGEQRLSNFLIWQACYAEFYFTDVCWPDFLPEDFRIALKNFGNRVRRFGDVSHSNHVEREGFGA